MTLWAYWWAVLVEAASLIRTGFNHPRQIFTTSAIIAVALVLLMRRGDDSGLMPKLDDVLTTLQATAYVLAGMSVIALSLAPWRLHRAKAEQLDAAGTRIP